MTTDKTTRNIAGTEESGSTCVLGYPLPIRMSASGLIALSISSALVMAAGYGFGTRSGRDLYFFLWYNLPAVAAAAALLSERALLPRWSTRQTAWDALVFILCIWRALSGWLPASGHAIFTAFALMTTVHPLSRAAAGILLLVTLYTKIVIWHWDRTLWPGLLLGACLAWCWRRSAASRAG